MKSAILYEVFPRNHGKTGTFQDITDDLERIRSLGTDIVWLMPFYPTGRLNRKGKSGSPYAISDYRSIDPALGDFDDFQVLVESVHDLGMKLIIDIVFNHTSCDSNLIKTHPDWFLKDEAGNFSRKENNWSDVYDLDYSQTELWRAQIDTLKFWCARGIDGFRCDVASLVPLRFWESARSTVDPDRKLIWLAESVHKSFVHHLRKEGFYCSSDPELHSVFDLTYDYDGFEYLTPALEKGQPIGPYLNHLFIQQTLYPADSCKLRFLENHDVPRVAGRVTNQRCLKNWSVFYALLPGTTLIYAGQEYGLTHLPNLFERDKINWPEKAVGFYNFFKKLMIVSRKIKRAGTDFDIREIQRGLLQISWSGKKDKFTALADLSLNTSEYHLDMPLSGEELLTCNSLQRPTGITRRMLPLIFQTA
ncbi:MAG: alpha-amylase [FCB group bacterium]|nr:alpha-amylase [FCB group bacterium]